LATVGLAQFVWVATASWMTATSVGLLLLLTRRWHMRWTADHPDSGPQKLHINPTPRIGGLAVVAGLLAGLCALAAAVQGVTPPTWLRYPPEWILAGGALLFITGLAEDLTGALAARVRLLLSMVVGAMLWFGAGLRVTHADFPLLDFLLSLWPVSMVFTMVAVAGLVHAMNIVDGLNGLLAGINLAVLSAIFFVALRTDQSLTAMVALICAASTLGFALFNFPAARMFCGDAGAYVIGFVAAVLLVSLMEQQVVSPWFGLTVVIHPVVETLYSAWRRSSGGRRATLPDARHMHSLWMARLRHGDRPVWLGANAGAALRTAGMATIPALLATFWPNNREALMAVCLLYVAAFVAVVRTLDAQEVARSSIMPADDKVTLK
jgi:UDP-N-acetylmuramyl pentapeptide phosphotransferase/UDP-N-acetylglucosamine-1-phosphate transferase